MDLNLTGKHALVCGASEGIGRAAAHELALLGADVTVLARRAEVLQQVVDALPRSDAQQHGWLAADVSQTEALRAQVQALAAGKPVHILVNNTGGPPGGPDPCRRRRGLPRCVPAPPARQPCARASGACRACRARSGAASST